MKLYTNLVPVIKGSVYPSISTNGVLEGKVELVKEGNIFKLLFIGQMQVYLKHKGQVFVYQTSILQEFFKETEMDIGE